MVQLPDEILEKILCRLSVKDLFRFKCVCKSWLALISSPYFVKLHLNRSVQSKSNLSLFLSDYNLFRVDFNSLEDFEDEGFVRPVEIDYLISRYPYYDILRYPYYGISICGSCDGLLCITIHGIMKNVFLWNPSTKKSIQLPLPVSTSDNLNSWVYRFGYDNTNNDYKVVKLMFFRVRKGIKDYEIKVYSLKSNSWHSPKKFSYHPKLKSIGDSIICGAMHWISKVGSGKKRSIVAFDLGTEIYRVISLPKLSDSYYYLYLNNLEGCLSATCRYHYSSSNVDIFLLKEYGGKNEHWSKLITISQPLISLGSFYDGSFNTVKAIAYSKCEELNEVYTCMESIVPLDVPEAIPEAVPEAVPGNPILI
ncbi:F-box/kelch-repeat protein At3g06240-like [Impatiens glandulifera]|uniref:F-box/kelch-repeat protein At3g06240-like n=1 Tax=Impatiens glandulifera TaxID=253017 RepID=UPI001FB0E962|nr:F-box/kelch-repeat protein At3g06240-like [Impatiens glandulifera]